METKYFLGIDVAKKTLRMALTADGLRMVEADVENTPKAIAGYFNDLKKKFALSFDNLLVCAEHTGIYTNHLLNFSNQTQLKICLESAVRIKKSQGLQRGKSDKIDATRIAQYVFTNAHKIKVWKPDRPIVQNLECMLTLRQRLVDTKKRLEVPLQESNAYLDKSLQKRMTANCKATLSAVTQDIHRIEKEICQLIKSDQKLTAILKFISSVPGIGLITSIRLIIESGEFERITEVKQMACHAGIAPFPHTSGTTIRGKTRISKMANMKLKTLLHMAAMAAIRSSTEIRLYYNRRVEEGKNKMSVINAVRNKLLARAFACVKNQRCYEKNHQRCLA
jgi:transposase